MAGTRLQIVVSFWILLWIWIGISIYESGLYQDAFFIRYVVQPIHKMYDELSSSIIMQQQQHQFGHTNNNTTDSLFLLKNHPLDTTTRIKEWKQQQALLLPLIPIIVELSTSTAQQQQQHDAASKWQHIFDKQQQQKGISIQVVVHSQPADNSDDDDVAECSMTKKTVNENTNTSTSTTTLPDVWICDSSSSSSTDNNNNASTTTRASTKTRIVYDKSISSMVETTTTRMIVYPSSFMLQQQQQQQQQQMIRRILFPTSASSSLSLHHHYPPQHQQQKQSHRTTTTKWQIRLILDTNITQWKYIVAYIQEWIQQQQQQQKSGSTIWESIQFQTIQRTDQLVNLVRRRRGSEQQQYLLSISDVTQALKEHDNDTFETITQTRVVYIYVPQHVVHLYTNDDDDDDDAHASNKDIDPTTMTTSTVAQVGMHRWIHVVDRTTTTSAVMDDIPLQETLIQIHNHIMTQYWGIPWYTTTDEKDVIIETQHPSSSSHDGTMTVPTLYQKLYYGRVLPPLYETVIVQTQTVGTMLETASVSIPSSMIRHFMRAMDDISRAQELYRTTVETNTFLTAAPQIHQLLLDATQVLQGIQMDHIWVEPSIDFPLEQYAAIFAPLLFPLLIPLLATLFREYKRYRRLVQQQRQRTKVKVL